MYVYHTTIAFESDFLLEQWKYWLLMRFMCPVIKLIIFSFCGVTVIVLTMISILEAHLPVVFLYLPHHLLCHH